MTHLSQLRFLRAILLFMTSALIVGAAGANPAALQGTATVSGLVTHLANGTPAFQARVTLFTPNLSFFRETRTAPDGSYDFTGVARGIYRLGVAAHGLDYIEINAPAVAGPNSFDFALVPESQAGSWQVIGNTLPELFDATDIAILRPTDGFVMFCHDTVDPVLFHPVTGQKVFPQGSGSEQGCMNASLLVDGSILMCGGQNGSSPGNFTNAIPWVKRFKPGNTWQQQGNMLLAVGRWYPGLARLNDGRFLIMGGGTSPNAQRTDTCELYDPATQGWSWTATMNSPLEFPPCGLLYGGKLLRTWGTRPQLYDPMTGTWADTGQLVYSNRQYPGHSDHSLLVLSDGRGLIVGLIRAGQSVAEMTEFYSPVTGAWSAGTSPSLKRMQCEVVYLPDGQVLVQGGDTSAT
ncbi:MAG: carboxypeptidase regulatory-like domain-containing protein, partial [Planctomycetota bacterium]